MKKLFSSVVTFILINTLFGGINANAQVDINDVVYFPTIRHLYYHSETQNNIDRFFSAWEAWSSLVARGTEVSEYNEIFKKNFIEECAKKQNEAKYLTVPLRVKVIKYNCNIHPDSIKVDIINDLIETRMPESISYFTPVIESEKKVLYLTSEAEEVLSAFIDEPAMTPADYDKNRPALRKDVVTDDDWEKVLKRRDFIREYVPVAVTQTLKRCFTSYPLIKTIFVGNDGYYIELRDAYSGEEYFVPWNAAPIYLSSWIS